MLPNSLCKATITLIPKPDKDAIERKEGRRERRKEGRKEGKKKEKKEGREEENITGQYP